jgi:REP-associated tyrosine transposase
MARIARVIAPGHPHYVTQRGNRGQRTFFRDDDYRAYLALQAEWTEKAGVRVLAYCLMQNHVHLIVVPETAEALGRGIGEAHRRYTRRVNARKGWRGHLWQGRFASFVMEEQHLVAAARYIERNPVKLGLAKRAEDWPWSSAAAHVGGRGDALAEGDWLTERMAEWTCTWRQYLRQREDEAWIGALQRHERTGRPLGDKRFVQKLGRRLGRDLLPGKPGRPRKGKKRTTAP